MMMHYRETNFVYINEIITCIRIICLEFSNLSLEFFMTVTALKFYSERLAICRHRDSPGPAAESTVIGVAIILKFSAIYYSGPQFLRWKKKATREDQKERNGMA